MLFNARLARRTAIGAIGTGAVVGAMFAATPSALAGRSAAWRPYRSYAGMHLWRTALARGSGLDSRP